ncbi:hypothetical protein SCA03_40020 [Streptomyces cacaoi]|uniref:Uncharacterized protein n=1 Tax=Streptomyces cacaoi TaxID=1898 RepID=A0A4Y3R1J7_STRCI|nr:hypothetical protein SCA03_40020 [Streptomyces cacaoi]
MPVRGNALAVRCLSRWGPPRRGVTAAGEEGSGGGDVARRDHRHGDGSAADGGGGGSTGRGDDAFDGGEGAGPSVVSAPRVREGRGPERRRGPERPPSLSAVVAGIGSGALGGQPFGG